MNIDLAKFQNTPKSLDFSKFPTIVPGDDEEEIAARAKNLTSIQQAYENLYKLLESYIHSLTSYDAKIRYLQTVEQKMLKRQQDLSQTEHELTLKESAIIQERKYIDQANIEIRIKTRELEENKNILIEIQKEKDIWEQKKLDAVAEQGNLDKKLKVIEGFSQKEKELTERESLIERSAAIDGERKKKLDLREDRITNRERQLALDKEE